MQQNESRINYLWRLYNQEALNASERMELMLLMRDPGFKQKIEELIGQAENDLHQAIEHKTADKTASIKPDQDEKNRKDTIGTKHDKASAASDEFKKLERDISSQGLTAEEAHRIIDKILEQVAANSAASIHETDSVSTESTASLPKRVLGKWHILPLNKTLLRIVAGIAGIVVVYTVFFQVNKENTAQPSNRLTTSTVQHLTPKDAATLTLADGTIVALDSVHTSTITEQNGTKINLQNGQIAYDAAAATGMNFNTLTTPKGKLLKLQLPDGSEVWLNAASSLKFPTKFASNQRVVELQGEAFFVVQQRENAPFIVITDNQKIEVLGTSFNVNAYNNENIRTTTVVEGKVKIRLNKSHQDLNSAATSAKTINSEAILIGGQQATTVVLPPTAASNNYAYDKIKIAEANTAEATAWKEGRFQFENANIDKILRQLERWYAIYVKYDAGIPHVHFTGMLPMKNDLLKTLDMLVQTGDLNYELIAGAPGKTDTLLIKK